LPTSDEKVPISYPAFFVQANRPSVVLVTVFAFREDCRVSHFIPALEACRSLPSTFYFFSDAKFFLISVERASSLVIQYALYPHVSVLLLPLWFALRVNASGKSSSPVGANTPFTLENTTPSPSPCLVPSDAHSCKL